MLSRIKLSFPDLRRALLEIDDARLSMDDLKAIGKHLPSNDEISRIRDFGDVSKLAKADQYFSEVRPVFHVPPTRMNSIAGFRSWRSPAYRSALTA